MVVGEEVVTHGLGPLLSTADDRAYRLGDRVDGEEWVLMPPSASTTLPSMLLIGLVVLAGPGAAVGTQLQVANVVPTVVWAGVTPALEEDVVVVWIQARDLNGGADLQGAEVTIEAGPGYPLEALDAGGSDRVFVGLLPDPGARDIVIRVWDQGGQDVAVRLAH